MSTSSTTAVVSAEEIGFLAGGPGRAAEAALARLIDGGLVRVSREGLVTAVHQNGHGATAPIEGYILAGVHGTARPLRQVIGATAGSQEMGSLHQSLVARGLVRRQWGKPRGGTRALRTLLILLAIVSAFTGKLIVLTVVLLFFVFLLRKKGRVTAPGKGVLRYARRNPRGSADVVALHGMHQRRRRSTSDSGGGCSSSYDYSHDTCGSTSTCSSSSCSSNSCSGSSSCSSSGSSCSSSSCSSSSCSCSSSSS